MGAQFGNLLMSVPTLTPERLLLKGICECLNKCDKLPNVLGLYCVIRIRPLNQRENFDLNNDSWTKSRGAVSRRQSESGLLANVHLRQGENGEVNNLYIFSFNFKEPLLAAYERRDRQTRHPRCGQY